MKKFIILFLFAALLNSAKAQFGTFASAVFISVNGNAQFYDANTQQPDANAIGPFDFNGNDLGTYVQNSGKLYLNGAEIKTYKNNAGDVCSATMYYTIYPVGSRPASPVFTAMDMPFFSDCNTAIDSFNLGGGPCNAGDQKWQANPSNTTGVDLTAYSVGTYTLEVYYQINGTNDGVCGDAIIYDNNSSSATNYTANFTITVITPVVLKSFSAAKQSNNVVLNWTDVEEINNNGFEIERSTDGKNFTSIGWVASKGNNSNANNYSYVDNNVPDVSKVFYRLQMKDINGSNAYSYIVSAALQGNSIPIIVQSMAGNISAKISGLPAGKYAVQVYSINGSLVSSKNLDVSATGVNNIQMSINGLSKSQYVLVLRSTAGELLSKANFINQ